ncbi:DUF305 domain-containing protein [Modestobacter altitudinis]|uniref:DUF305 domain-containing protein n=1 Tax=Modestobacter altitudinis TaxID=2213158 RepID=UPI00110CD7EC|nr:DUF305 domain-containing protein [Modestobacter altitudinis]
MTSPSFRSTATRGRSRLAMTLIGTGAWTGLLIASGGLPQAAADNHTSAPATSTSAGSSAPSTSAPQSQTASPTDVRFASMMVPHHQMGIELTQMAIDKSTNAGVREVAQKEKQSQQEQLPSLQAVAASGSTTHEQEAPLMTFNQQEMDELMKLTGEAFDLKWLDVFSSHHMAAIMMADTALPGATSDEAKSVEQEIHDGQLETLGTMNSLREELSGSQTSRVPSGSADTGAGSTAGLEDKGLLVGGSALLVTGLAAGAVAVRRRASTGR